jgi:hypothetical protein
MVSSRLKQKDEPQRKFNSHPPTSHQMKAGAHHGLFPTWNGASPLTDRPAFCRPWKYPKPNTLLFIDAFLLNSGTPAFADVHCGFYMLCAISIAHFWLLFIFGSFPTIDNTRSQRVSTLKEFVSKRRRTGFAPSKNFLLEQEGF